MNELLRRPSMSLRFGAMAMASALCIGALSLPLLWPDVAGASTTHEVASIVISTSKNPTLGRILVSGKTVYTLKASKIACTGACTSIWPEVLLPKGATKAKAGEDVSVSKLGSISRGNGVRQVTYAGKALYWFAGDSEIGQVTGNGLHDTWGTWSVVVVVKPTKH